ncbi:hypothetical protein N8W35_12375 [Enterobacter roggenkampii]|uniref:hypothetical protein n=1 Tax=Enterobacter roggenkampii TaxID=1812935 RepID=UPI0021C7F711|nr:hypothetical protein [Enterobacter roggenkampii]MCU3853903.1 hypothetical protein [Enterobacter roggenkampii]
MYTTDYIGSLVATTPLGNIEHENIPRFLTTESIHSLPQAVSYGHDPIPQVLLYGRKDIVFFMTMVVRVRQPLLQNITAILVTLP